MAVLQRKAAAAPGDAGQAVEEVGAGRPGVAARRWLGVVSAVALMLFVGDAILVSSGILLRGFDIPVETAVQRFPWGPIAALMRLTNASGGWGQVILAVVAVVGLFLYERRAGLLMALGCFGSVIDSVLKTSFARHRPTADIVSVLDVSKGYSFPSGHAVFFTWLAFMLAVAFAPKMRPAMRPLLWLAAGALIVIACVGRVWAGAHWPSDVIGGFLLALSWSAFVLCVPERWLPGPAWSWIRGRLRQQRT
jgi:undecaprenyl-diphosphatase